MFCTNCGKQINYDSPVCVECARAAEEQAKAGWQNGAQNGAYQQNSGNGYGNYYSFEPINPDIFGTQNANSYGNTYGTSYGMQPKNGSVKKGLGRSIVAAVLAQVSAMFATAFLEVEFAVMLLGILFTALPCAIVSLCLGVASIKCFREARAKGEVLPIPTLIIGIYATVNAGAALMLCTLLPMAFL